jgi:hypothetical protein
LIKLGRRALAPEDATFAALRPIVRKWCRQLKTRVRKKDDRIEFQVDDKVIAEDDEPVRRLDEFYRRSDDVLVTITVRGIRYAFQPDPGLFNPHEHRAELEAAGFRMGHGSVTRRWYEDVKLETPLGFWLTQMEHRRHVSLHLNVVGHERHLTKSDAGKSLTDLGLSAPDSVILVRWKDFKYEFRFRYPREQDDNLTRHRVPYDATIEMLKSSIGFVPHTREQKAEFTWDHGPPLPVAKQRLIFKAESREQLDDAHAIGPDGQDGRPVSITIDLMDPEYLIPLGDELKLFRLATTTPVLEAAAIVSRDFGFPVRFVPIGRSIHQESVLPHLFLLVEAELIMYQIARDDHVITHVRADPIFRFRLPDGRELLHRFGFSTAVGNIKLVLRPECPLRRTRVVYEGQPAEDSQTLESLVGPKNLDPGLFVLEDVTHETFELIDSDGRALSIDLPFGSNLAALEAKVGSQVPRGRTFQLFLFGRPLQKLKQSKQEKIEVRFNESYWTFIAASGKEGKRLIPHAATFEYVRDKMMRRLAAFRIDGKVVDVKRTINTVSRDAQIAVEDLKGATFRVGRSREFVTYTTVGYVRQELRGRDDRRVVILADGRWLPDSVMLTGAERLEVRDLPDWPARAVRFIGDYEGELWFDRDHSIADVRLILEDLVGDVPAPRFGFTYRTDPLVDSDYLCQVLSGDDPIEVSFKEIKPVPGVIQVLRPDGSVTSIDCPDPSRVLIRDVLCKADVKTVIWDGRIYPPECTVANTGWTAQSTVLGAALPPDLPPLVDPPQPGGPPPPREFEYMYRPARSAVRLRPGEQVAAGVVASAKQLYVRPRARDAPQAFKLERLGMAVQEVLPVIATHYRQEPDKIGLALVGSQGQLESCELAAPIRPERIYQIEILI